MMKMKSGILLFMASWMTAALHGQEPGCGIGGQSPATAIPLCGTVVYDQETLPSCNGAPIPADRCGPYQIFNNYWYSFTCLQAGTLGISITPKYPVTAANLGDDYNWQLFDITKHDPQEVFSDPSLFVVGNWSGTYGVTGTSSSETDSIKCVSPNNARITPFSRLPMLLAGHQYLLLVTHFTPNKSGYILSLAGGNALLSNSSGATLRSVQPLCSGQSLAIGFLRPLLGSSLAPDGSDFVISPAAASILAVDCPACSSNFQFDSLVLQLDKPLPPGNYQLSVKTGSDGNSLLDPCKNPVPPTETISFTVTADAATPLFANAKIISCHPTVVELTLSQPVQTASLAKDGTDFSLFGPGNFLVQAAEPVGVTHSCTAIRLTLSGDLMPGQSYEIQLGRGSDGNGLLNQCGQEITGNSGIRMIAGNCSIQVPSAFTPNGDGHNDYLYPLNNSLASKWEFRVYNRYGQLVFRSTNSREKWDGTVGGRKQPVGLYVWMLQYTDRQTGKTILNSGTSLLIR